MQAATWCLQEWTLKFDYNNEWVKLTCSFAARWWARWHSHGWSCRLCSWTDLWKQNACTVKDWILPRCQWCHGQKAISHVRHSHPVWALCTRRLHCQMLNSSSMSVVSWLKLPLPCTSQPPCLSIAHKTPPLSNTEFFLNVSGVMVKITSPMYVTATLSEHCAQNASTVKYWILPRRQWCHG